MRISQQRIYGTESGLQLNNNRKYRDRYNLPPLKNFVTEIKGTPKHKANRLQSIQ